jgi:hypothetical protein
MYSLIVKCIANVYNSISSSYELTYGRSLDDTSSVSGNMKAKSKASEFEDLLSGFTGSLAIEREKTRAIVIDKPSSSSEKKKITAHQVFEAAFLLISLLVLPKLYRDKGCGFFENKTKNMFATAAQHEIRVN